VHCSALQTPCGYATSLISIEGYSLKLLSSTQQNLWTLSPLSLIQKKFINLLLCFHGTFTISIYTPYNNGQKLIWCSISLLIHSVSLLSCLGSLHAMRFKPRGQRVAQHGNSREATSVALRRSNTLDGPTKEVSYKIKPNAIEIV
jgi:hypothetical protein